MMPATSKNQQMFMAMELKRKREGKKIKTKMSEKTLSEFASTKRSGLPLRRSRKKR